MEEEVPQDIVLTAAELRFKLRLQTLNKSPDAGNTAKELLELIKEHNMLELYKVTWEENNEKTDESIVDDMRTQRDKKLKELDAKKKEAEAQEGEVEVRDVELERAKYLAKTDSLEAAIEAHLSITNLTSGKNIDKYLSILRLCLAWNNDHLYKKYAEETKKLIDKGGDWDRRNRFTVYNGVHYFRIRDFEEAAKALLEGIATFTATEVFDYKALVHYTVIGSLVSLPRTMIKEKLIDSPEIRQVILELPELQEFLNSFYECRYHDFLKSLLKIMVYVRNDMYLSHHANYYLKEMRLRAYQQFLRSYLSVKLQTMSQEFGLSEQFLDEEVSSFIASNRLTCKIDKVNGVVEMKRVDKRNQQYQEIIKKGDLLMNRVQRLSRVITY